MATVWELVQASSTAPQGSTFWEHLNNLDGGGSLVLSDGLEIEMEDACVDVELDLSPVDIEVETPEYDVEVDTPEYEVEVC